MQWIAAMVAAALVLGLSPIPDRVRHAAVVVIVILTVGVWFTQMK